MGEPWEFEAEGTDAGEEEKETLQDEDIRGPKRLYRDADRKVVGGVAAGVAAYLNIDVLWVRLAFVVFTIFWLSGALVYIILWIAMPEARTTAEKLQMRGEKVNISNIEKSIKEEVTHLKDKINDLTSQTKKKVEKAGKDSENVFEQTAGLFISILRVCLKVLVVIIGIVLLLTGIGLAIGFLFAIFGWGGPLILENDEVILMPLQHFMTLLPISAGGAAIFKLGLTLFIGIPLVMLIYNAFRMIFGIERIKYVGITALNVWVIGLIITLFFSFRIAREYRQEGSFAKPVEIEQPVSDTLYITINEELRDKILYDTYDFIHGQDFHLVVTEEGIFYDQVELALHKSETDEFSLTQYSRGRGRTLRAAKEQAESTVWHHQQDGDTLVLDPFFEVGTKGHWRGQHVRLELYIPEGSYVYIDESIKDILFWWGRYSPRKLAGNTWLMTENGLELADGEALVIPTAYYPEQAESNNRFKPILIRMANQIW
jgi:phage shock protein PspC (stress-responsive transcriptional regulator)